MSGNGSFTVQEARGAERRAATRQQIVTAVRDLLGEGAAFAELSVGRIAERAGVSRATFYLHFSDKRELLADLAAQELADWQAVSQTMFDDPGAGRDVIEATIGNMVALWQAHRPVLSALVELAEYDDQARTAWRAAVSAVAASVSEYAAKRDDIDYDDLEMSGMVIAWMAERACHQILDGASPAETARVVKVLTDIIWRSRKPND